MRRAFSVSATIAWACAAMSLFGVHAAAAQVAGGSVGGIVTDQQGAALPNVTVTASAEPVNKAPVVFMARDRQRSHHLNSSGEGAPSRLARQGIGRETDARFVATPAT